MTEENICPSCHRPLPPDAPGGLCPACVLMGAREEVVPAGLPDLDQIRAAFPQFEILECIGRGGMGAVYKARQPQLDRMVALKILLPGLERDPGFAERFAREARALAKLNHPSIVAVYDFGESGGFFWLTMEYVDGVNLRQAMQAARFTPAQALAIIPELCSALQFAHDHGILHRDIKPENILLDARGKVKVADFGIARMAGDERLNPTLTMTGAALGTTAYVAPEQIENPRAVDHRADLYSLGVVLYEMLTGELPLGRFPAPSERSASDPRLDEVVFRSLEKQPEKRYQQAEEFSNKVAGAASSPPLLAPPATPAGKPKTSVLAVAGAACTGFSMLLGVPVLLALAHERSRGGQGGLGGQEMIALLIFSVLPALGGMLLGAISWVRIRDAEGALRGIGLARFAVLAWLIIGPLTLGFGPTILLKALILGLPCYAIYWIVARLWKSRRRNDVPPSPVRRVDPVGVHIDRPRHLPWTFGLMLAGAILVGIGCVANNILVVAPGACAVALGYAGGWWALWGMKKGRMPLTGRNALLLFLIWLPLLALGITLAVSMADAQYSLSRGKGDYLKKVMFVHVAALIPALLLFRLAALPADRRQGVSGLRHATAWISLALIIGSLVAAKRFDGHWPVAYFRSSAVVRLNDKPSREVQLEQVESPVRQALYDAAGEYGDRMEITCETGRGGAATTARIAFLAKDEDAWKAHMTAFGKRFAMALPAETAIHSGLWDLELYSRGYNVQRERSSEHFKISCAITIAAAVSAILAAWAWFPMAILPLGTACLGAAWALTSPLWPDPVADRMLIDGPPLPPLVLPPFQADFSTPEKAATTVFESAWRGDLETMKAGISKRWRAKIDERKAWKFVHERLAPRAVAKPWKGEMPPGPDRSRISQETSNSSGWLNMIFEDGGWRLDDMPFTFSLD